MAGDPGPRSAPNDRTSPARVLAVGGGLLAVLVVLFVVVMVATRHGVTRVGVEPLSTAGLPTARPVVTLATATEYPRTPTPAPTTTAESTPPGATSTAGLAAVASAVAITPVPIATMSTNEGRLTAHPPSSQLEYAVEAAYLHFWDVRKQALYDLDDSHLGEVEAGAQLSRDTKWVADLRTAGKRLVVDTSHLVYFTRSSMDTAEIYDVYDDRSYYVDAKTSVRLGTPVPSAQAKFLFQLQRLNDAWKVTDAGILQS